ncbi:hypothetical protein GY45DRAFT_641474 [Cubamyces sp. BRFM 1775]|nr:hypothetical protein GY45DRAFT_641474 [Cubamyces sp. BRFM 1775]
MDSDHEAYILLLLSDSNLPTGSFVASAGLESYVTHGFFTDLTSSPVPPPDKMDYTVNFLRDSLSTYARSALPFVLDAHAIVEEALRSTQADEDAMEGVLNRLRELDELYEVMTLNHVSRRASKTQGVALLTLFSKGFSKPRLTKHLPVSDPSSIPESESRAATLVDRLKFHVRREDTHGHLPICWGVLTAALGLSSERSQYLHLFLQARSLLSASVRLNTIGPYAAQQLLLHTVRPLVESEMLRCKHLTTGSIISHDPTIGDIPKDENAALRGPAMTWPLGEILAARHDLQHSRIFNS